MPQLTKSTPKTEYELARNRWYAYRNSAEYVPGGIAANILLSALRREKNKLNKEV